MKRHARTFMLAAFACCVAGCAGVPGPGAPTGAASTRVPLAATPFTALERDFVARAAARTLYEIEVSKLAAERAISPAVRDFAQQLVQRDTQMNEELASLMIAHGVAPPNALTADKAAKLRRLAALPRSDGFDNGYIRVVGIEDHRAAISMFERARRQVRDRDLRAWIDRSLTALRAHLAGAQVLAPSLAG